MIKAAIILVLTLALYPVAATAIHRILAVRNSNARAFQRSMSLWSGWK